MRLRFETEEAFREWKEGYEKTNFMHWIRPTGRHVNRSRNSRIEWREYYRCSRDGDYRKYEGSRKTDRRQKRSGRQSSKLGKGGCQAHMKVWKPADTPYIVVDVFEEHTGHALGPENMQFLRKKPERQTISIDGIEGREEEEEEEDEFRVRAEDSVRDPALPHVSLPPHPMLPLVQIGGLQSLGEFNRGGTVEPAIELVTLIRSLEGRSGALTTLVECARRIERETREAVVSRHATQDSQDEVGIAVEHGEPSSSGGETAAQQSAVVDGGVSREVESSAKRIVEDGGSSRGVEGTIERVTDRDGVPASEFELGEMRSFKKRKLKE
eukprot:TRINITY_DN24286_c0_g1_i1.p1 TRINITY_DN24286_c0_g1~~TRINITY_DN24286_c0_g1_i1.p1  ORF type:complete len:325 (+),score=96.23 TRINITY_DN24286_c0_g1_i1:134-1108(+)